jgi:hypothetical protein
MKETLQTSLNYKGQNLSAGVWAPSANHAMRQELLCHICPLDFCTGPQGARYSWYFMVATIPDGQMAKALYQSPHCLSCAYVFLFRFDRVKRSSNSYTPTFHMEPNNTWECIPEKVGPSQ